MSEPCQHGYPLGNCMTCKLADAEARATAAEEAFANGQKNEHATAAQLSEMLSGGGASTWDEIMDAAEALKERATAAEQELAKAIDDDQDYLSIALAKLAAAEQERDYEKARSARAEGFLHDISVSLSDAGVTGGTVHGGVLELIQRTEAAEARVTALAQREAEQDKALRRIATELSTVHEDERGRDQRQPLIVALERWTECIAVAKAALASPSTPSPAPSAEMEPPRRYYRETGPDGRSTGGGCWLP